jgi:hypothetical protein
MPRISAPQSVAVMRGALGGVDVGLGKIVAFVQQPLAGHRCQRVGEAVAEIEAGGMPALAESAEGVDGGFRVPRINGRYFDFRADQEISQTRNGHLAPSIRYDNRRLHKRCRRDKPSRSSFDAIQKRVAFRLVEDNGQQS